MFLQAPEGTAPARVGTSKGFGSFSRMIKWFRSLAAELFPAWHRRRLRGATERRAARAEDALSRFRQRIALDDLDGGNTGSKAKQRGPHHVPESETDLES